MTHKKTSGEIPPFNQWFLIGRAMSKVQFWSGKYDISFQFWGDGNNNVFIEKDCIDIASFGGEDTPLKIMERFLDWAEKANPSVSYPVGIEIVNQQP